MNMRLSFLSRNVTPENMATSSDNHVHMGTVHVDRKIVKEVLSAASWPRRYAVSSSTLANGFGASSASKPGASPGVRVARIRDA